MKIYYFNDTKDFQMIHIGDFNSDVIVLNLARGEFFEVPLKENQVPFIKVWANGHVLLSGTDQPKV